jgi:hypothetical protein
MIINLKRFEYDYNTMTRKKLNDYCEFPERINFKPWTKEGIRERELKQKKKGNEEEEVSDGGSQHESEEESKRMMKNRRKAREGAPIDEDMLLEVDSSHSSRGVGDEDDEMVDEEDENLGSAMMDTTGKYFDEGVMEDFIDIVPEDEEDAERADKKAQRKGAKSAGWNKLSGIQSTAAIKPKGGKMKSG